MKLINKDSIEYTTENLLNSGYIKVGSKTYCEYWKKGDVIETFNTVGTLNTNEIDMYTEALNENKDKTNRNRLKKIHRLKRENKKISTSIRKIRFEIFQKSQTRGFEFAIAFMTVELCELSERIGKNSAKIQRLRTLISQSKN